MYAKDLKPEKLTRSVSSAGLWRGPEFWAKPRPMNILMTVATQLIKDSKKISFPKQEA